MSAENRALAQRLTDEVWNKGNLAVVDDLVTQNFVDHDPASPGLPAGPESLRQQVTMYRTAFPDLNFTVHEMICEGDKVVSRWTCRGTHKGNLQGIPPTNKQITVDGISIARIEGGKIAEQHVNWDSMGMMQQLNAISMKARAGA